jgi:hypothetical protein
VMANGSGDEVLHLWQIRHEQRSGSESGNSNAAGAHRSGGVTARWLEAVARQHFMEASSSGGLHR